MVPFEPWHLTQLDEITDRFWIAPTMEYGRMLQTAGPCHTLFAGPNVLGCGGFVQYWEGRVQAWTVLALAVKRYPMALHRLVTRMLSQVQARRIECTVDPTNVAAVRWAVRLGFQYEGTMRGYTPDGATMDLYALVRDSWPKP